MEILVVKIKGKLKWKLNLCRSTNISITAWRSILRFIKYESATQKVIVFHEYRTKCRSGRKQLIVSNCN